MMTRSPATVTRERSLMQKLAQRSAKLGLDAKNALHEVFHENTKLGRLSGRVYSSWIVNFNRSQTARQTARPLLRYWQSGPAYKPYTLMERRALPAVTDRTELERTIAARRSIRAFTGAPLSLDELARLLFFSYGRTDARGTFRAVASGGALYPLELYVVALAVDGLEPGVYHYGIEHHHLDLVRPGECLAALKEVVYWQGIDIDRAAAAVILTAVFRRSTIKYLDRGYRMILMEAGEAAQNFCLQATSMALGACLLGGFNDDGLSGFLDVDGVDEAPLLPALVGRPAASES
jgi:SagB-type dehydrogenase family enzyme